MPDNDARLHLLRLLGRLFAWAVALLVSGMVYLLFHDVYQRILRPPPFEYTRESYTPERSTLCPGDTLRWKAALIVHEAPTALYSHRTIWSVALARTVVPAHMPNVYIWTDSDRGQAVARMLEYKLPPLPAGPYEVRVASSGMNTDADAYEVPFTIGANCGKGEP